MLENILTNQFILLTSLLFFALFSAGPIFAIVIINSLQFGHRAGIMTSLGVALALPAHYLLAAYPLVPPQTVISLSDLQRYLAIGLLFFFALAHLRFSKNKTQESQVIRVNPTSDIELLGQGFFLNLTYPVTAVSYASIFGQTFIASSGDGTSIILPLLSLAIVFVLFSLIAGYSRMSVFLNLYLKHAKWIHIYVGIILIIGAIDLIIAAAQ